MTFATKIHRNDLPVLSFCTIHDVQNADNITTFRFNRPMI